MKTLLFTALTAGALLMGTASAHAFDMVHGGWHCWFKVSAQTCYWPHNGEPYYNVDGSRNVKVDGLPEETDTAMWGNHGGNIFDPEAWKEFYNPKNWHVRDEVITQDTEVAMWTPTYELKAWYCMKGNMGKQMQNEHSTCIGGTPRPVYGRRGDAGEYTGASETTIAMMTPEMVESWRASLRKYSGTIDLDVQDTQLAFGRRGSTCSPNPYGRRSTYCNESEVESPLQSTASVEFGSCLLNDEPIDLESLVDCRTDRCLGRKFYYGL